MSNQVTFDPASNVDIHFRKNRNGSKVFRFLDSDGNAFNVSAITFILNVKSSSGKTETLITKSIGSGLTLSASNEITVSFSETETNIREREYYWEFFNDTNKTTWLCGDFIIYTGEHEPIDTELDVTVNTDPDLIVITISDSMSSASGLGDFSGPSSAVADNFVSFDGISGKLGKDSGVSLAILDLRYLRTTRVVLTGDITSNTLTLADTTGLQFPAVNGKMFYFRFLFVVDTAAIATGLRTTVNGPTQSYLSVDVIQGQGGSLFSNHHNAYNGGVASPSFPATTGNAMEMFGFVRFSATGDFIGRYASETAGSLVTLKAGSFLEYAQLD